MNEAISKMEIIRSLRAIQEEMKMDDTQANKTVAFDAIETLRMAIVSDTSKYGVCKDAPAERAFERVKEKAKTSRLVDELRTLITKLRDKKRPKATDN